MSNVVDLNELLNLDGLSELSYQEKMETFKNKAKILGFDTKEIDTAPTGEENNFINTLDLKKGKNETVIGVYFFYLSRGIKIIDKKQWDEFKNPKNMKKIKVSPWNKDDTASENDILYIGQRHVDLVSRLRDHTVRSNEQTQSLKLYKAECPSFEYNITLFYQTAPIKQKMRNKIFCLMLESIAKNLFPTKIGK
jgi:hypothetical protein